MEEVGELTTEDTEKSKKQPRTCTKGTKATREYECSAKFLLCFLCLLVALIVLPLCPLWLILHRPAHEWIIPQPKSPGLILPLLSIVSSDSWSPSIFSPRTRRAFSNPTAISD